MLIFRFAAAGINCRVLKFIIVDLTLRSPVLKVL